MMRPIPVADKLRAQFPEAVQEVSEAHGEETLVVSREAIVEICRWLRDDPDQRYDLLMDVAGVDYLGREPRFEVVYQLYSVPHNRRLRLKVRVPEQDLIVASVTTV